jgi:hypothetical protein
LVSFLLGVGIGYGSVGAVGVRQRHVEPQASSAEPSPPPIPMPGWGDETGSDPDEVFFHIGEEGEKRREGSGRRTETRTFFLLELFLSLSQPFLLSNSFRPPPQQPTPEPFESGLNNERISLLKAAEVARRRNWTLVLPSYKDFHAVLAAAHRNDASSSSPPVPVILPFSHFYDEQAFADHARRVGFRVVRSLPPNRFHACTKMLALAATWPRALTSGLFSSSPETPPSSSSSSSSDSDGGQQRQGKNGGFAGEYGVVCLPPHAVWHAIQGYDLPDLDWSANSEHAAGLRPSELYRREVERMVRVATEKFGKSSLRSSRSSSSSTSSSDSSPPLDFVAVHVRVEDDWARVCSMGADRSGDHWLKGDKSACLVGEGEIAERVATSFSSSSNSSSNTSSSSSSSSSPKSLDDEDRRPLAFVMSAAPTSEMPRLCDPLSGLLRCFTPDEVWLPTTTDSGLLPLVSRTGLVRSYVSFLFAAEGGARALYGNVHSTFSRELGDEMRAQGKAVVFYNPACPEGGGGWCP